MRRPQAKCPLCGCVVQVHAKLSEVGQEPRWCPMSDQPVPRLPRAPLFPLGQVVATPGALQALEEAGQRPEAFLNRHIVGDWGELDDFDRRQNDRAVHQGLRLLSAYRTMRGVRLWVITEWDRSVTTLLLPEEY